MLSDSLLTAYREDGFIVIPDVFSAAEVTELRRVTDQFVGDAAQLSANDEVYDLEDTHSTAEPRVRRIKTPHLHHTAYAGASRHPTIVGLLADLWGSVCFDTGKLNMKSAGFGAPVEWHQDWAFYPHTNDDLAAVGIMLDDVDEDNGPMLVIPGSHRGPIYDHHGPDGRFCGAIDPAACSLDLWRAVPCLGKAGSITVHHARLVHGSATNLPGEATILRPGAEPWGSRSMTAICYWSKIGSPGTAGHRVTRTASLASPSSTSRRGAPTV